MICMFLSLMLFTSEEINQNFHQYTFDICKFQFDIHACATQQKESSCQQRKIFRKIWINMQKVLNLQAAKNFIKQKTGFAKANFSLLRKSSLIRLIPFLQKYYFQTYPTYLSHIMEALPVDIRNLPHYYVPKELFICTCILLTFFLVWTIIMFVIWAVRSRKHIHNYEYIADHNIRREFEHAKKAIKQKMEKQREEENQILQSQTSESNHTHYSPQLQAVQMIYNRQESRLLEFICLSVMVAININSFTSTIMEVVAYLVAVVIFGIFNVFRIGQRIGFLRYLYFLPLIAAYLPFLIFKKELKTL